MHIIWLSECYTRNPFPLLKRAKLCVLLTWWHWPPSCRTWSHQSQVARRTWLSFATTQEFSRARRYPGNVVQLICEVSPFQSFRLQEVRGGKALLPATTFPNRSQTKILVDPDQAFFAANQFKVLPPQNVQDGKVSLTTSDQTRREVHLLLCRGGVHLSRGKVHILLCRSGSRLLLVAWTTRLCLMMTYLPVLVSGSRRLIARHSFLAFEEDALMRASRLSQAALTAYE
jgi:hypothetical protein